VTFGTLAFAVVAGIIRGLLPAPFGDVFLLGAAAFIVENAVQGGAGQRSRFTPTISSPKPRAPCWTWRASGDRS
jgi:hypothetical protein